MVDINTLVERSKQVAEEVLAEATAYYESVGPVEVETVFGEKQATFQIPFIHPTEFEELAERFAPRPGVAVDMPLWFNIDKVARHYPNVKLVVDGATDDMYRVREKEAVYIWPELYDQMPPEDRQSFRMAVWALNVWEPQQRKAAKYEALKQEGDDNA
ncbi:hypothetical protein [Microbacterium sp.]|uniref:hypothetical protein n=1 Tax=Microbacterium sp. TaxID=51671 RepID=UPI002638DF83|nr:hypothetical protein [Microbacterium sp.]MCV0334081.1 hypothetical protein [Microbacterium sp.]MCV0374391.1 hypothetical protein [Microbacterium sp.]MCV0389463.1 hypothetical protein [Microbacterium sp.]MCV0418997.1 hypothetical protein [Microbacterium sp.]MCV0421303.1 hypothetical protein [Microbacterium sp.]